MVPVVCLTKTFTIKINIKAGTLYINIVYEILLHHHNR